MTVAEQLAIALVQINPTVGDVDGNLARLRAARARAAAEGAELVVFPELAVTGYPPEDLILKPAFVRAAENAVAALAADTADGGPAVLLGAPWRDGAALYNAAMLLDGGRVTDRRAKVDLPNYGVFDEVRLFDPGPDPEPIVFRGVRLGVMVCEDMWENEVACRLAEKGAAFLLVINGSPFEIDKPGMRRRLAKARHADTGLGLVYVNQVGGQDELVFDGASFVLDARGEMTARLASFAEDMQLSHWARGSDGVWTCAPGHQRRHPEDLEAIYQAMMLGLRDYVGKSGFPGVVLGMSGGIDSALSAAVAVDALGPEAVHCVMMPSPYTSRESLEDAAEAARLLGVRIDTIPIAPIMDAFNGALADVFAGRDDDTTEENIQARARGVILMALSNKFGTMLLTTGNKSEMSVGYATLYGDMNGGYSVLKDVYKTTVFRLSHWRNHHHPEGALGPDGRVVPQRIIDKPPSAELKPGQTDQDSLPPYDALDAMLRGLIEEERSVADIAADGLDRATVQRVWRMLDRAEYKRRQAPPGVKITTRAFGRDRRYPIINRFTDEA